MSNNTSVNRQESSQLAETVPPTVVSVRESLVTIDTGAKAIKKNEVGHICVGEERLMAEVLRVRGDRFGVKFPSLRERGVFPLFLGGGGLLSEIPLPPGTWGDFHFYWEEEGH